MQPQLKKNQSRLEKIIEDLRLIGVRQHYVDSYTNSNAYNNTDGNIDNNPHESTDNHADSYANGRGNCLKIKYDFVMGGVERGDCRISYIRGFTTHGSEFEAYIPEKQSGQVIAHLAGLGVMPSTIETTLEAEKIFGALEHKKRAADMLDEVNRSGYYGNTLLQTARGGRASIVVYGKGFNREEQSFWQRCKGRLVTDTTAKQQLQDAIALSEIVSTGSSGVALASHSLTTQEGVRFLTNPHSYSIDNYCDASSVKTMIFQALYTSPDNAVRNAESIFKKIKTRLKLEKSLFWRPLFKMTAHLYRKYNIQLFGVQPFFADFKKFQLSGFYHNNTVPTSWLQASVVNAASAAYFLESPYGSIINQEPKHKEFLKELRYVSFIPQEDAICSVDSQRRLCEDLKQWDTTNTIRRKLNIIPLEGYGHNIFVDYPFASTVEKGLQAKATNARREYIHYLLQMTT